MAGQITDSGKRGQAISRPDGAPLVRPRRRRLLGRFAAGYMVFLLAGCAAFPARHVLPEADANHIELSGFHDIRFWGDASPQQIRAIIKARSERSFCGLRRPPRSASRRSTSWRYPAAPKMARSAQDC